MRRHVIGLIALLAATPGPTRAVEMLDPNLSRDAAYCRDLTAQFRQMTAGRVLPDALEETRRSGERGAYLCRFERYREGAALLERALMRLREDRPQ